MSQPARGLVVAAAILLVSATTATLRQPVPSAQTQPPVATASWPQGVPYDSDIMQNAQRMLEEGRQIFRHDTFGSEAFWGDQLKLHQAIVGEKLGGVGPGVSPKMALSLGLKVDAAALRPMSSPR
jgi:hypothetical protein